MKITQKQHDKETERNEKEEKTGYTFNVSFSTIKLWVKGQMRTDEEDSATEHDSDVRCHFHS